MMKAYVAHDKYHYEMEGIETIVFAENESKAKQIAFYTEACEDSAYTDIRVRRLPAADKLYKGKSEMDWNDMESRIAMVRDFGWSCVYRVDEFCYDCPAKQWCSKWEYEEAYL